MRDLIGEQEIPNFKQQKKKNSKERDPNKEYKQPKKKGSGKAKRGKRNHKIEISQKKKLEIDKSTLPDDAQYRGTRKVIIQEIEFRTDNVEFEIPRWYSPSLKKYFEAELPFGFKGYEFGPKLRTFTLMMNTQCRVTENKIKSIFDTLGIFISMGHINKITQTVPTSMVDELLKARETALTIEPNAHLDASGIRINGVSRYLQCICEKYFSWFDLLGDRSRYEILKGLVIGERELIFSIDETVIEWLLERMKRSLFIEEIEKHLGKVISSEVEFEIFLESLNVKSLIQKKKHLRTACLLSSYKKGLLGTQVSGIRFG